MNKIYTIGHSTDSLDYFIGLLATNQIDTIVDVRSVPYSRFVSQFNKDQLAIFLKKNNINYVPMGKYLGARYKDKELLFDDGKVNFSKVINTKRFQEGITRIETGIKKGYKIALMCSEKNPIKCHRFSLVSHFLHQRGYMVNHIMGEDVFSHKLLESKLLDYYKEYHKISMDISKIKNFNLIQNAIFDFDEIDENKLYFTLNKLVAYNSTETEKEHI